MNDNTISLVIDFKNMPHKYPYVFGNKDNYSSDLSHKSHMNYRKSKNDGGADTLLEDLASGALYSAFYAIRQTFFNTSNRMIEHEAERLVKDWVKSNPDLHWED